MKFFKKSKFDIINYDRNKEKLLWKITHYVFLRKHDQSYYINNTQITFYNEDYYTEKLYHMDNYEAYIQSLVDPLANKNIFKNKVINYIMNQGKKLSAYSVYNKSFNLFFSFFKNYSTELSETYSLYDTYYEYAQKNPLIFFEPIFIYYNLVSFLQPSFVIAFKKTLKTKRKSKKPKEITINYIRPNSRFYFCVKSIHRLAKSYDFRKYEQRITYNLLNLFLLNKNSQMYKKKITSYQKLMKLRKTK